MNSPETGVAQNGKTRIFFSVSGSSVDEPVLFLNGLGSQLINFLPGWVEEFRTAGFFVIRMDNRDVGLSSKTEGEPPSMEELVALWSNGHSPSALVAPYQFRDMAQDCIAVLDALNIEKVHVWGMSMGGMIAQTLAISHSHRLRSMTSVMSTTGELGVGTATSESAAQLIPDRGKREDVIRSAVEGRGVHSGPLFDISKARELEAAAYDRCHHPDGKVWQMFALLSSGSRANQLRTVSIPSMVIHGRVDSLVQLDGGEATADLIPGAELVVYDDMGHDIPEPLWKNYRADLERLVERTR